VSFLGAVDSAGIKRLLSEADICVFPSRFDNFPNACLEAMAAGRPIVATRSGGMEEMLGPTDAGLLVKPGNVRELTNALVRLIEDPAMRSAMAQRARQRVLHAYSDDVIGPLYEQTYAEAIEMRGKRREATGKRS
jgi:glycosyltransferase involved in cell wall biosynthesis